MNLIDKIKEEVNNPNGIGDCLILLEKARVALVTLAEENEKLLHEARCIVKEMQENIDAAIRGEK